MDEEKKFINTGEKVLEKFNPGNKASSNQKIKPKPSNILEKKITNNIPMNSFNNNTSTKNQLVPIPEKNSINKNKKHNSIAFGIFQKKLNTNSSHKNLDLGRRTIQSMNPTSNNNNNVDSEATTYFNATNINNDSKLVNTANNTTEESKKIENLNANYKEKEKDAVNILTNTHETNADQHIQKLSVFSGGGINDLSINQVSLLETKNAQSTNLYNTINTFSHQNSFNNMSTSSDSSHIKVTVRFRPMNNVENEMVEKKIGFKCVDFKSLDTIGITNSFNNSQNFTFDRVYDDKTSQEMLYTETAKPLITDILKGYNGTIFTYGQSGSGKTYTMYGAELLDEETQGIIPRAINEIFEFINSEENKEIRFELKFSMLEIYQEQLYDLLNPGIKSQELKIKEHSKKGIYVENLSEVYISSQEEFLVLIHEAERARIVKETGLNKCSSRSHLLFQLQITQKFPDDTERRGLLNLIDLAGSEKVSKTHAIGETLNEAKKINSSLSILGKVISILATNTGDYVPYRESKLTRILQDSLGGNSKTILVVNCSIHSYNADETIYTLNFAKRAKKIKNKVKINIKHSAEQLEAIIEILSNKLRLANEEINKLKGIRGASPLKSSSMLLIGNEENSAGNLIPKSVENSLIKNLFTTTFSGVNIDDGNNKGNNYVNNNLNSNEILDSAELIKDLNLKLKKKDQEIALLNEKLDLLQLDNKNVQEKLDNVNKQNNMDKYIESLDKSMRENLESLKEICLANKKDEIEALTLRMNEIKQFYDDFEKNYVHLFRKITDFKETDFEKNINMIINQNFEDVMNNTNHNLNHGEKSKNLNVNIKHFNNINNITVHNHLNSNNDSNNNNFSIGKKFKNEKDNLSNFNQGNSEFSNIKNYQNTEESVSPPRQNATKKPSFQDPDSILGFVKPANKNSSSPSVVLSFNNNSHKNSSSNRGSQNKIPNYIFRNNTKSQLKKGKNVLINQEGNKDLNIEINKDPKENKETKVQSNHYFNNDENFDEFIRDAKGNQEISSNVNSKKELIFESTNNIKSNDFKDNIISEAKKKANLENEIIKKVKKINNLKTKNPNSNENQTETPIIEFDNEEENISSANSIPEFGGNLYNFNFHCEDLFKKIEMQISSNNKSNSSDSIVLSYKKIFLSNKLYSIKIFDEFLKRKEYNSNQKSYENLVLNNSLLKKQNAYRNKHANDSLFSPESKNKNLTFIKDNYFMSPNSDLKDLDKIQDNVMENNLFSNRFKNQNKNACNNININNLSNNNDYNLDVNLIDSDYFAKMKTCILKLMLKIIYFENINYDILNKLSIDLKIFQSKSKNASKVDKQLEKISNIFTNYLDVLQELKKFKFNTEYQENYVNKAECLDGKGAYNPIPQENYLNSANNLNNMINNNNNFNTESSSYNNPIILTGIKRLARLSTLQTDMTNMSNTNNPILLQPKNSIFKQSKMNLNSNIIKNITKRSSLVLNNLGFGLAFRKSIYEPTGSSPVLCPNCNNYYYNNINNNGSTKPFNIGINEDGSELKNATLSNTQVNDEKPNLIDNLNKNPTTNNSNNYVKLIHETNLVNDDHNNVEKINSQRNPTSNKTVDKDLLVSNSSAKTDSMMKSRNQSKNVSFFLNAEQKENLLNNTEKGNAIDKFNLSSAKNDTETNQNITPNIDKSGTSNNKNFNKNSILKTSTLKNYQNMNKDYNRNEYDKKQNHDSKLVNESDASMDNASHSKFYKGPSPDLIERNKFFNQNINFDSNKNIDLITTFNNNINNNFNSQNQISKLVSTNNSNKMQLPFMRKNTFANNELNDLEIANIRSKWEALRQSVISTTSNNNLKIIQDENFSELKLAKKETLLYKNCFDSITTDYKKLKSSCKNTEKFLNQELENHRNLKEVEIEKFAKALEMYNDLYSQQIKVKEFKIKQLAALIDHMVENEAANNLYNAKDNLGTSNNYDTILITEDPKKKYEFILERKNSILNTSRDLNSEEKTEISLLKLTDFLVNQEGTATKKLDYITIELSDNPELIKFKYGSGLGQRLPTKSPLYRNLTTTLAGDQNNEITMSELSD